MKVLLIDDLAVVRAGLTQVLKSLDENVAVLEASCIADAGDLISRSSDLDLIVVDALAGGGSRALPALAENPARAPVVVFSRPADAAAMLKAIDEGAKAFLPKDSGGNLVAGVLSLVLAGGTYLPPEVMAHGGTATERAESLRLHRALQRLGALSRRQREIVALLSEGLSNQAIGERTGLSLSTVKSHVAAAMKALGAQSRTQVALIARNAAHPQSTRLPVPPADERRRGGDRRCRSQVAVEPGASPTTASAAIPEASRSKAVSIANIGHVVRIFLNSIIGFSDMLTGEVLGPLGELKYKEYARHISDTGNQLLDIIGAILQSAQSEGGARDAVETWIDVATTASACARMVGEAARRARVRLAVETPQDLPKLIVNERHFKQVLLNLLLHAVARTPPDGTVRLTAAADGARGLKISVRDSGSAISAGELKRILEPFAEADDAAISGPSESWLGTSLVKSLAEIQGGALAIESLPDQGTAVSVRFPMERTALSQRRPSDARPGAASAPAAVRLQEAK